MEAFPTTALLRPDQVKSTQDEIRGLESKLTNRNIEDKGEVQRQLRRVRKDFETQAPKPPANPVEEDRMVKRSRELLSMIVPRMNSQEEMRKNPPGAVEKYLKNELNPATKRMVSEWQHIMRRLTAGSDDLEAANIEKHRPVSSTLNMDNAQIPGKQIFLPADPDGLGVTFSEAHIATVRALDPELADRLASLSNRQRAQVKGAIEGIGLEAPSKASQDGKRGVEKRERMKREMSQAQKDAARDRMAAGRAAAKAKREAQS